MDLGAAKFFGCDDLIRDSFDNVRSRHEHVARIAHHEDEIGHRRRVDVAAGARPHDDGYLRNDAARHHVALEHFAIAAKRCNALLDPRASRIEQTDDRRPHFQRHVLDLDDLLRMGFRQRSAKDREVLGEHEHGSAVHGAPARHDAVSRNMALAHVEIRAAVLHEHVELLEAVIVHQEFDPFARRQLSPLVLGGDAVLTAPNPSAFAP